MATIPTYQYQGTQVMPTSSPEQSFDSVINAITQGVAVGASEPTIAGSIAGGLQDAVTNYQNYQINEAKVDVAKAQAEAYGARASGRQLSPQQAAAQNMQIQMQEMSQILQSGDANLINQALGSGKYLQLLSDPQAAEAIGRTVVNIPGVSPKIINSLIKDEYAAKRAGWEEKDRYEAESNFKQVEAEFVNNDFTNQIVAQNEGMTPYDIAKRGQVVRSTTYERDPETGEVVRDIEGPNKGLPRVKPFDPEDKNNKSFDIIDKETLRVIVPNADADYIKLLNNYKALGARAKAPHLTNGPFTKGASEGLGITPPTIESPKVKEIDERLSNRQPGVQPIPVPTPPQNKPESPVAKIAPAKSPDPTLIANYLPKLNFVQPNGKIEYGEEAKTLFTKSLGLEYSGATFALTDTLFNAMENPDQGRKINQVLIKDRLAKESLKAQYQANKGELEFKYNDSAVQRHNEMVRRGVRAIAGNLTSTRIGAVVSQPGQTVDDFFSGDTYPVLSMSQLQEVSTPEELFVLNNYSGTFSFINTALSEYQKHAARQNTASIRKVGATPNALAVLQPFK